MYLEQLPNQPGDIVRDRRTGTDYAIQSVVGLALGAGFVVYAINILTGKIESWKMSTAQQMLDQNLLIRKGNGDSAEAVIEKINSKISQVMGDRVEAIEKLNLPENKALKDLILLGIDEQIDPLPSRFVKLAESIVEITQAVPNKDVIRSILREATDPARFPDAAIEHIANSIHTEAISRVRVNKFFNLKSDTLRNLLLNVEDHLGGDAFILSRLSEQFNPKTSAERTAVKELLGDLGPGSLTLQDLPFFKDLPAKAEDRVRALAERMFKAYGGKYDSATQAYIERNTKKVVRSAVKGDNNKLLKALGAFLLDEEVNPALRKRYEARMISKRVIDNPYLHYDGRANPRGKVIRGTRGKATAIKAPESRSAFRREIDFRKLLEKVPEKTTKLSVDVPTFFDTLLKGSTIKIGDQQGTLSSKAIGDALFNELPKDKFMILNSSHIRKILDAKETGNAIDMSEILPHMQANVDSIRHTEIYSELSKMHGTASFANKYISESPVVALEHSEAIEGHLNNILSDTSLSREDRVMRSLGFEAPESGKTRIFKIRDGEGNIHASTSLEALDKHLANIDSESIERPTTFTFSDETDSSLIQKFQKPGIATWEDFGHETEITHNLKIDLRGIKQPRSLGELEDIIQRSSGAHTPTLSNPVVDAFLEGYNQGRVAIAQFNDKSLRMIGSEVETSLERQFELAKKYMAGSGALLDIETIYDNPFDATTRIRQITLGKNEGGAIKPLTWLDASLKSPTQRANALIKLSNELKGLDTVGTQGRFDFDQLIEQARILKDKVPGLAANLQEAIDEFGHVQQNKLFDIQTIYQMSGHDLGSTSQQAVSLAELGEIESHTSEGDVLQAHKLISKLKTKFLKNLEDVHLIRGTEIAKKGVIFYDSNTLSPFAGSIRQLMDIKTETHRTEKGFQKKVIGVFRELNSVEKDGYHSLVPTNNFYQQEAGSVSELAAITQKYGQVVTEESWNALTNGTSLAAQRSKLIQDSSTRYIRSLNPTTATYWDELGDFDKIGQAKLGPFGAFNLRTMAAVDKLHPVAHQEYERLQAQYLKASGETQFGILNAHVAMDLKTQAINKAIGGREIDSLDLTYIHANLMKTLDQGAEYSRLMDKGQSEFAKFRYSAAGKALLKAAQKPHHDHMYSLLQMELMSEAANNNMFTIASEPRLRLAMGLERASMYLNSPDSASRITTTIHNLASEAVFSLSKEGEGGEVRALLDQMGFDSDRVQTLAEGYREKWNTHRNLPSWKEAIHKVGLGSTDDPEFGYLVQAQKAIANSDAMKHSVLNEVTRKTGLIQNLDGEEQRIKLTAFAEKLHKNLTEAFETHDVKDATVRVFDQLYKDSPETMAQFLTERYEAAEFSSIPKENVAEAVRRARETHKYLHGLEDNDLEAASNVQAILQDVYDHARTARERGLEGADVLREPLNRLNDIVSQHRQGIAYSEILSKTRVDNVQQTARIINKVRSVAGHVQDPAMQVIHKLELESGGPRVAAGILSKVSVPLLVLGGVVGLLAAHEPRTEGFNQGNKSDNIPEYTQALAVSKYSEIPGQGEMTRVWHGETKPFQLDMTFKGFIQSKEHEEHLRRQVFNIISNSVEVRRTTGDVQDKRNREHRMSALDVMRRHM